MRPNHSIPKQPAEQVVKDIRRATRRHFSAENKIRSVLKGLPGDDSLAELCCQMSNAQSLGGAASSTNRCRTSILPRATGGFKIAHAASERCPGKRVVSRACYSRGISVHMFALMNGFRTTVNHKRRYHSTSLSVRLAEIGTAYAAALISRKVGVSLMQAEPIPRRARPGSVMSAA
jgi:hypothetical protein